MDHEMTTEMTTSHSQIGRQIAAVERAVLAFQSGIMREAGSRAAADSNDAIILTARLSAVWKRLGACVPCGTR